MKADLQKVRHYFERAVYGRIKGYMPKILGSRNDNHQVISGVSYIKNSIQMLGNEKLKELAAQLKQPQGKKGLEISNVMNETNAKMTFHSVDRLNLLNGNITLELGHGNCQHLSYLLNLKNNLIYYGLELSELMIEEAQQINEELIVGGRAFFYLYNGENIPFADNFFDRIFTVNTIYFWNNPGMLLSELYRVIKPDGILNITFEQKSFMEQLPYAKLGG